MGIKELKLLVAGTFQQPKPKQNSLPYVWDLVMLDMKSRDEMGFKQYGTRLQLFNGRFTLVDEYQEELDRLVYKRQAISELLVLYEKFCSHKEKLDEIGIVDNTTLVELEDMHTLFKSIIGID